MAYIPKPNEFGLFPNTRTPTKSDHTGGVDIECPRCRATVPFWVSGWNKVAKSGTKYISIALRPKELAPQSRGAAHNDDDIRF